MQKTCFQLLCISCIDSHRFSSDTFIRSCEQQRPSKQFQMFQRLEVWDSNSHLQTCCYLNMLVTLDLERKILIVETQPLSICLTVVCWKRQHCMWRWDFFVSRQTHGFNMDLFSAKKRVILWMTLRHLKGFTASRLFYVCVLLCPRNSHVTI